MKICKAWNTLINFAGKKQGKTDKEIESYADGLGTYYNMDYIPDWENIIKDIQRWLNG